jgi:hypothetical protein
LHKRIKMIKPIKICNNPECRDEIIEYKSSKIAYCNDYCRNRAGYLRRLVENEEINEMIRGHKENYKALKIYFDVGIYRELLWKLEKLGFDTRFLPEQRIFLINGIKTPCYQIKEIIFQLNPDDDTIIMFKNKNI